MKRKKRRELTLEHSHLVTPVAESASNDLGEEIHPHSLVLGRGETNQIPGN